MPTSLRDIPGASRSNPLLRDRRARPSLPRLRRGRDAWAGAAPGLVRQRPKRRRGLFERHRRRPDAVNVLIAILAVGLVLFFARTAWEATRVDVEISGVSDGAVFTVEEAESFAVRLVVDPSERLDRAELTLDGRSVIDEAELLDDGIAWAPQEALEEGLHVLELRVPRPFLGDSSRRWSFVVDGTPPEIRVPTLLDPVAVDAAVTVSGRVEPDAELFVDGEPYGHDDGEFELSYPFPPAAPVRIEARDRAGNHRAVDVIVPVERPETRAVHVTAAAWADDGLRAGIMALVESGRVDAVELDIKDEGGVVGHASGVALAERTGAELGLYDLREVVELLHAEGVRVIGRLVAFRDPLLADYAWEQGSHDWVVQQPDGSPHPSYGGFTNFAHPGVRRYNVELALEAARAGVDEILYDYVRRPEGSLAGMRVPGMEGPVEDEIVEFLAESFPLLREAGVLQGASVFGIAADRPWTVGQDVPRIARHVDYVSPMVYPSLWVKGEYRVPDPVRMPFEIVRASLADFQEKLKGTGARLVPWLQDFSLGPKYGAGEVRAQIRAAAELGIGSFLLWNPLATYTADALDPVAR